MNRSTAIMCLDCEMLFEGRQSCPSCGSQQTFPLGNWIKPLSSAQAVSKKPYTVLLLYPDYMSDSFGQETYLAHVEARDPESAVMEAQQRAVEANTDEEDDWIVEDAEDFYPLFVCEGHLGDLYSHRKEEI